MCAVFNQHGACVVDYEMYNPSLSLKIQYLLIVIQDKTEILYYLPKFQCNVEATFNASIFNASCFRVNGAATGGAAGGLDGLSASTMFSLAGFELDVFFVSTDRNTSINWHGDGSGVKDIIYYFFITS